MKTILSLLLFLVLLYWVGRIYLTDKVGYRTVRYGQGSSYVLSRNMYFVIFTVCTAPIFLYSLSLLKYGLWTMTIVLLLLKGKVRIRFEGMTVMYALFFLWMCYTMTYTSAPRDGAMLLIKYALPMLFLWLGYSSIGSERDLIVFLKVVNVVVCIYCFFIGGVGCKLMPWLYYPVFMGVFGTYAAFADFLTSIFIVPILLYWLTREKKYIWCALWMVLSTLLELVRTGMGGMVLVFGVAMILKNRSRAIPTLLLTALAFASVVLFVPDVNNKFFGGEAKASVSDVMQGKGLGLKDKELNMNGREYMWQRVKENCYYGNESYGGGLGSSMRFVKEYAKATDGLEMMHNDYLQVLCDTGHVGILLLALFYLVVIFKVASHTLSRRSSSLVKLTGIMALSSMVGVGFAMYYNNVVSNSMQSMVMPYIYLGFFLKALEIQLRSSQVAHIAVSA